MALQQKRMGPQITWPAKQVTRCTFQLHQTGPSLTRHAFLLRQDAAVGNVKMEASQSNATSRRVAVCQETDNYGEERRFVKALYKFF